MTQEREKQGETERDRERGERGERGERANSNKNTTINIIIMTQLLIL